MQASIGVAIFIAVFFLAGDLAQRVGLPVPGSILAMLCLVCFFVFHGRVPTMLDAGARMLFRVFPLLFIPPLIGIVTVLGLVSDFWPVLLFAITGSSFLGIAVSALLFRWLRDRKEAQ